MSIIIDDSKFEGDHFKILKKIRAALNAVRNSDDFVYDLKYPYFMSSGALFEFKVKKMVAVHKGVTEFIEVDIDMVVNK